MSILLKKYGEYVITEKKIQLGIIICGFLVWLMLGHMSVDLIRRRKKDIEKESQKRRKYERKQEEHVSSLEGKGGLGIKHFTSVLPQFIAETGIGPGSVDEGGGEAARFYQYIPVARRITHSRTPFGRVISMLSISAILSSICNACHWITTKYFLKEQSKKMRDIFIDESIFYQQRRAITGLIQALEIATKHGIKIDDHIRFCDNGSVKIHCSEVETDKQNEIHPHRLSYDVSPIIISEHRGFNWADKKLIKYDKWKQKMTTLYDKHHNPSITIEATEEKGDENKEKKDDENKQRKTQENEEKKKEEKTKKKYHELQYYIDALDW